MAKVSAALAICLAACLGGCQTQQPARAPAVEYVAFMKAREADKAGRYEEAFAYYSQAAGLMDEVGWGARVHLADMYFNGRGTRQNEAKAFQIYQQMAGSADKVERAMGLSTLGRIYEVGIPGSAERDRVTAARHYKAAIDSGSETAKPLYQALSRYPDVYVEFHPDEFGPTPGKTAPGDAVLALQLLETGKPEAAFPILDWHGRNGNDLAQLALASVYFNGRAVAADKVRGLGWLWLSARNGNVDSQYKLGQLFDGSASAPRDSAEAEIWLTLAMNQGHREAPNTLGLVIAEPVDRARPADWKRATALFHEAVKRGSTNALVNLGDMAFEGRGQAIDKNQARSLYERAADQGNARARTRLFERYNVVHAAKGETAAKTATPAPSKPTSVEVYERLSPSVFQLFAANDPKIDKGISTGSAVAISETIAITNCHVIEGMPAIGAIFDRRIVIFTRVTGNKDKDICILRTDYKLRPIGAGRRFQELRIGEKVYALGSPIMMENTFSDGIISGLRIIDGVKHVQTSAPISHGSSGGGLFDEEGRLIGITSSGLDEGQNLNFAIAVDEVLAVINAKR